MAMTIPDGLPPALRRKLVRLVEIVKGLDTVLVAFSGGVDSALLARVARDVLGERAAAVTASSPVHPDDERDDAIALARVIGIRHRVIALDPLTLDAFRANPPDRCYHCKREIFGRLLREAEEMGLAAVADGANADDARDFRPGLRAVKELGVRSPLKEAGLTKDDIRQMSRALGLSTWDRPSRACLASRFPYGDAITRDALRSVDQAETFLRGLGLRQLRVRRHGDTARIEVPPDEIARLATSDARARIVARLKQLGFTYVTLDLEGFRSGSLNEALSPEEQVRSAPSKDEQG